MWTVLLQPSAIEPSRSRDSRQRPMRPGRPQMPANPFSPASGRILGVSGAKPVPPRASGRPARRARRGRRNTSPHLTRGKGGPKSSRRSRRSPRRKRRNSCWRNSFSSSRTDSLSSMAAVLGKDTHKQVALQTLARPSPAVWYRHSFTPSWRNTVQRPPVARISTRASAQ